MDVMFTTQSAGRANAVTGSFTTDATAAEVTIGFRPRYVRVVNATDGIVWEWMEGMADDATVNIETALAIDTSGAIVAGERGFTLSAAAAGNAKDMLFFAI